MVAATVEFSTVHIVVTALIVAAVSVPLCVVIEPRRSVRGIVAVCVTAALATLAERLCANLTQLNDDGIGWFSANDLLAPALTYIALSGYADVVRPSDPQRFGRLRVAITIAALAVNVIAI